MYKRLLTVLLALLLSGSFSLAEEAAPLLVDRINSPKVNADFAFAEETPLFEVICPQVIDCDTILLRCGGETLLVDVATSGQAKRIINMCKQLGITHIDRVINTHPHEDHIGGFRNLIKEVEVGELWICFTEDYNKYMADAVLAAQQAEIPVKHYADGDVLTLGDATIEVWKLDGTPAQLNDCSAQFYITYGERTMLMTADLEVEGQAQFLELKGEKLKADVLKYPHHGLDKALDAYMDAVDPLFTFITNNQASRPGRTLVRSRGIPCGYVVPGLLYLTTDGQTWVADRIPSAVKY